MTTRDLFYPDGRPVSGYLNEVLETGEGRMTLMYILAKLGFFTITESAESAAVRNAAVNLLNDITEQTGFSLTVDFIR
jgi:hypothetical protein